MNEGRGGEMEHEEEERRKGGLGGERRGMRGTGVNGVRR